MRRNWSHVPFERYADDIIVHCRTEREANLVRVKVAARLKQCGLELHPEKTKVVYCKDGNRRETHPHEKFDFLGFTFRPRKADGRKGIFCSFIPAISKKAEQKIRDEIRGWKLHRCTGNPLKILLGRSIRNFGDGSTTMDALRLRRSGPSRGMSANRWFAGLVGNTRSYAITGVGHGLG